MDFYKEIVPNFELNYVTDNYSKPLKGSSSLRGLKTLAFSFTFYDNDYHAFMKISDLKSDTPEWVNIEGPTVLFAAVEDILEDPDHWDVFRDAGIKAWAEFVADELADNEYRYIVLSGGHATGKTTIANSMAEFMHTKRIVFSHFDKRMDINPEEVLIIDEVPTQREIQELFTHFESIEEKPTHVLFLTQAVDLFQAIEEKNLPAIVLSLAKWDLALGCNS